MFTKIQNFVNDPRNRQVAKEAAISFVTTVAICTAVHLVSAGVAAIEAKIEEGKTEEVTEEVA